MPLRFLLALIDAELAANCYRINRPHRRNEPRLELRQKWRRLVLLEEEVGRSVVDGSLMVILLAALRPFLHLLAQLLTPHLLNIEILNPKRLTKFQLPLWRGCRTQLVERSIQRRLSVLVGLQGDFRRRTHGTLALLRHF